VAHILTIALIAAVNQIDYVNNLIDPYPVDFPHPNGINTRSQCLPSRSPQRATADDDDFYRMLNKFGVDDFPNDDQGPSGMANFKSPYAITVDTNRGFFYVSDSECQSVRRIDASKRTQKYQVYDQGLVVENFYQWRAGTTPGLLGGIDLDFLNNRLYLVDSSNCVIYGYQQPDSQHNFGLSNFFLKELYGLDDDYANWLNSNVTPLKGGGNYPGPIEIVAGTYGSCGLASGSASSAKFDSPANLVVNYAGTKIYVSDYGNSLIRLVDLNPGTGFGAFNDDLFTNGGGANQATVIYPDPNLLYYYPGVLSTSFLSPSLGNPGSQAFEPLMVCPGYHFTMEQDDWQIKSAMDNDNNNNIEECVSGLSGSNYTISAYIFPMMISPSNSSSSRVIGLENFNGRCELTFGIQSNSQLYLRHCGSIVYSQLNHPLRLRLQAWNHIAVTFTWYPNAEIQFGNGFNNIPSQVTDFNVRFYIEGTQVGNAIFSQENAQSFTQFNGFQAVRLGDGQKIPNMAQIAIHNYALTRDEIISRSKATIQYDATGVSVTTIAGQTKSITAADGTGTNAKFVGPKGLTLDQDEKTLYISDFDSCTIRKMVMKTGVVTTLAGKSSFCSTVDGLASNARFYNPIGIRFDNNGNLLVADIKTIRKVSNLGSTVVVSTFAGIPTSDDDDGGYVGVNGTFSAATDVAVLTPFQDIPRNYWNYYYKNLMMVRGLLGSVVDDDAVIDFTDWLQPTPSPVITRRLDIGAAKAKPTYAPTSPFLSFSYMRDNFIIGDVLVTDQGSQRIKIISSAPTSQPTGSPTGSPTGQPSGQPSGEPTSQPTRMPAQPTSEPSPNPTQPSPNPTTEPTFKPSVSPSFKPTRLPTTPTSMPSSEPTFDPTLIPTAKPTTYPPTFKPTGAPTFKPTFVPTHAPTSLPTFDPTSHPTSKPSSKPTSIPTGVPSSRPTSTPSSPPSSRPTGAPSSLPTQGPDLSFNQGYIAAIVICGTIGIGILGFGVYTLFGFGSQGAAYTPAQKNLEMK